MDGWKIFGVVKEVGVDDEGLATFYTDYFPYPLYKDDALFFYNEFFGKQSILKLSTYNPFKLYNGYKEMQSRMKEKNMTGNRVGEGLVKGGVVLFDGNGKARYAYEEETGTELDMKQIIEAMKTLQSPSGE